MRTAGTPEKPGGVRKDARMRNARAVAVVLSLLLFTVLGCEKQVSGAA
jgi:hypothetical protein